MASTALSTSSTTSGRGCAVATEATGPPWSIAAAGRDSLHARAATRDALITGAIGSIA